MDSRFRGNDGKNLIIELYVDRSAICVRIQIQTRPFYVFLDGEIRILHAASAIHKEAAYKNGHGFNICRQERYGRVKRKKIFALQGPASPTCTGFRRRIARLQEKRRSRHEKKLPGNDDPGALLAVCIQSTGRCATLSLSSPDTSLQPGQAFAVNIDIDDATGVAACAFTVRYPSDMVEAALETPVSTGLFTTFHDADPEADPSEMQTWQENLASEGLILLSGAFIDSEDGSGAWDGAQTLFSIGFAVKQGVSGPFRIVLEQTEHFNPSLGWGEDVDEDGVFDPYDGDEQHGEPVLVVANAVGSASEFETALDDFSTDPYREFTVVSEDDTGTDGDGIDDKTESEGPNDGDGNFDGIQDENQSGVATLKDPDDGTYVTIEAQSCALGEIDFAPAPYDADYDYPFGLIDFSLFDCAGSRFVLYFHETDTLDDHVGRGYGPAPPDFGSPGWYDLPDADMGGVQDRTSTAGTMTVVLTEGALGDDASGDDTIRASMGPGKPKSGNLDPVSIPTLGFWAAIALAAVLSASTWRKSRKYDVAKNRS